MVSLDASRFLFILNFQRKAMQAQPNVLDPVAEAQALAVRLGRGQRDHRADGQPAHRPVSGVRHDGRFGQAAAEDGSGLNLRARHCRHRASSIPDTFTLDNGLEVVVVENHRAPVVAHWVWYKVGTADSPPGKSGLPHFLEHLMFKGTGEIPPGEFSKIVARQGGNDNAMTSYDSTAYFQMIAKDRLELVMAMEADRMVNLDLSDEHVYPERDVILEERRSRVDNEPAALLGEQLMAAQYLHHPYRLPVIGWFHEIAGYTREDALDFYRASGTRPTTRSWWWPAT